MTGPRSLVQSLSQSNVLPWRSGADPRERRLDGAAGPGYWKGLAPVSQCMLNAALSLRSGCHALGNRGWPRTVIRGLRGPPPEGLTLAQRSVSGPQGGVRGRRARRNWIIQE